MGIKIFNNLPDTIKTNVPTKLIFKRNLKRWLSGKTFYDLDEFFELTK